MKISIEMMNDGEVVPCEACGGWSYEDVKVPCLPRNGDTISIPEADFYRIPGFRTEYATVRESIFHIEDDPATITVFADIEWIKCPQEQPNAP